MGFFVKSHMSTLALKYNGSKPKDGKYSQFLFPSSFPLRVGQILIELETDLAGGLLRESFSHLCLYLPVEASERPRSDC